MLEQVFLYRVLVEPGDGAQPAGDRGAGPAPGLQVAGEGFNVSAADSEQAQGAGPAPAGELAQVERVGLFCEPAVPGQEAGEREPFGIAECWLGGQGRLWWRSSGTSRSG